MENLSPCRTLRDECTNSEMLQICGIGGIGWHFLPENEIHLPGSEKRAVQHPISRTGIHVSIQQNEGNVMCPRTQFQILCKSNSQQQHALVSYFNFNPMKSISETRPFHANYPLLGVQPHYREVSTTPWWLRTPFAKDTIGKSNTIQPYFWTSTSVQAIIAKPLDLQASTLLSYAEISLGTLLATEAWTRMKKKSRPGWLAQTTVWTTNFPWILPYLSHEIGFFNAYHFFHCMLPQRETLRPRSQYLRFSPSKKMVDCMAHWP